MLFSPKPLLLAVAISACLHSPAFAWTQNVAAGDTVTGETITQLPHGGDSQHVFGTANDTTVTSGGFQFVEDGGIVNNTQAVSDGEVIVMDGGTANDTTVDSTSQLLIEDGGAVEGADVYGYLQNGGGTDRNITLETGGSYYLTGTSGFALSENATIKTGASVTVFGNAQADDWAIAGDITVMRNIIDVIDPVFNRATLYDGANVTLNYNAVMNDTTVNGGTLTVRSSEPGTTATVNNTVQNGGTVNIATGGAAYDSVLNGGLFSVIGGSANNTVINTSGTMVNSAGQDTGTVINAGGLYTLDGVDAWAADMTVNTGSTAMLDNGTLSGASVIDGGVMRVSDAMETSSADVTAQNGGSLYLAESGRYQFGDMTLDDGNVSFAHTTSSYSTLALDSLSGSGTFYMNTDVAGHHGDYLSVTGNADGNFGVFVQDTGVSPDIDDRLTLINTGGGSASFSLANTGGVVDLGTYEYHLVIDGDHQWSLAATPGNVTPVGPVAPVIPPVPGIDPVPPTVPQVPGIDPVPPITPPVVTPPPQITPSTAAVLNMAAIDPLVNDAEMTSVRHRLEETRGFSHNTSGWVDVISTQNDVHTSAGAGFDQTLTGITVGIDRSLQREHGVTTQGVFFSSSHSDVDFDRGGSGDVDSFALGGYASYRDDNGLYIDGIFKANNFDHDVNARMTSGGKADGDYDTLGVGGHIEAGMYLHQDNIWLKPYGALSAFTSDNTEYRLSNGMQAHVDNTRSIRAEGGLNAGMTFALDNGMTLQPYAGVAITQEFVDDNHVDVNDDGHFTNDLSGTRGLYEVGLRTQLTHNMTAHVNASYANGAGVESPWVANAGVAWSF